MERNYKFRESTVLKYLTAFNAMREKSAQKSIISLSGEVTKAHMGQEATAYLKRNGLFYQQNGKWVCSVSIFTETDIRLILKGISDMVREDKLKSKEKNGSTLSELSKYSDKDLITELRIRGFSGTLETKKTIQI
jgi:hypothetical protein